MKKLILISVLVFAAFAGKAQKTVEYDTLILHLPQFTGYPMRTDCTFSNPQTSYDAHAILQGGWLFADYEEVCLGNIISPPFGTNLIAPNNYAAGFAQPYHLDSTMQIIGVASRLISGMSTQNIGKVFWRLYNNAFEEIDNAWVTSNMGYQIDPVTGEHIYNIDEDGYSRYYFANGGAMLQDFYLAKDNLNMNEGGCCDVNYALSIWTAGMDECFIHTLRNVYRLFLDTIFVGTYNRGNWTNITDTLICVQTAYDDQPWLKKNNEWIRFSDDSIYYLFQTTFLDIMPIVLVPRTNVDTTPDSNFITQLQLDKNISVYPNPAKNELFIQSDFKVMTLEIYNNLGVKVKEMELNRHEAKVDIANLPSGNYTLKLLTTQGEVKKMFVIK
ncbi:MAG: T9SS type A sorting domain-containing protein [Bacteroidales bacterium]|jgi:hypothetical protein|nr:T9SS type A sorting domain-containing protein [Bacteroidales bacterium]